MPSTRANNSFDAKERGIIVEYKNTKELITDG